MILDELSKSLQTGFIDKALISEKLYQPTLLVNKINPPQKVLSTILEELKYCEEFFISVAFVTTSGVATLINTLSELENKGIKGKVIVSQYLNFTQPEALRKLLKFSNIELRIATNENSHSKGYLFKKSEYYNFIIGSSNLTDSALSTNKEWNLKVSALHSSSIVEKIIGEFDADFARGTPVTPTFINGYEDIYNQQKLLSKAHDNILVKEKISPNSMQEEALENINSLRISGATKALIISATGTGKTYLSAFDAKAFQPKRLLFVVHRLTIAEKSMETFQSIFGSDKSMGVYSGNQQEVDKDFLFSTVQTISKQNHLDKFDKDHFDYIIIDESHRSGSDSYKRLLGHFHPRFLLGMTATPERTDGEDIFSLFDHRIAYEIRLNRAMEEGMLSNFHYYGVTDLIIDGEEQENIRDFAYLSSDERVKNIIKYANFYGSDNGITRGLVFCSRNNESKKLSEMFNKSGFRSIALTGDSSKEQRNGAIKLLESDNLAEKLDYIFTVDIFNEGIDIPKVNQIIMIRPTESAIIFVQQLGRGLRKVDGKGYLTVIDFIGNYSNNYLIPIALYGDTSYNKDALRRTISSGSTLIPGSSTINFDAITKAQIFESIDSANMGLLKDLKKDYDLLKYKLGRIPMMMDFIQHGSREPYLYVEYSKSYYNFICKVEKSTEYDLDEEQIELLSQFALNINNAKRVEECIIMKELITNPFLELNDFKSIIKAMYGYSVSDETIESCLINLNFKFIQKESSVIEFENNKLKLSQAFNQHLKNALFKNFLIDNIEYSIRTYNKRFELKNYINGFQLYGKYTRKDVCRILNWEKNYDSTVYGYKIYRDQAPLFVTYRKLEDISVTTQYNDHFINQDEFAWESKAGRKLDSKDVVAIKNADKTGLNVSLFIQKSNNEGADFYFMGNVDTVTGSLTQEHKVNDKNKKVPVVHMEFKLRNTVQDSLYIYLTGEEIDEVKKSSK
jgi:superfamily II DNA or RNA helicase/HKD family nuclease